MKILPVVHFLDLLTCFREAEVLSQFDEVGGLFLISHQNEEQEVCKAAKEIKATWPQLKIGINLLSANPEAATKSALALGLDMIWFDSLGVTSSQTGIDAICVSALVKDQPIEVFCGVAFKYQKVEHHPELAADRARHLGFIPTTSGLATGSAPNVEKIKKMASGPLAIASGMTPHNVSTFAPYLSHVLVATGISKDFHHVDPIKLDEFILNVG